MSRCRTHVERCESLTLPGALFTRLSDCDCVLAGRNLFGLGVATTVATQPCHCEVTGAEHYDGAMDCKLTAGKATLRDGGFASAWCRAIHCVGCATRVEPRCRSVVALTNSRSARRHCWLEKGRHPRHFPGRLQHSIRLFVTAKRKERRRAKGKTRKETRKEEGHLERKPLQLVCYSESERKEEAKKRLEKRLEKRENT